MSSKLVGAYLTRQELQAEFKISSATIYRWMSEGNLPKPIHLGANMVRWKTSDIEAWLTEREAA